MGKIIKLILILLLILCLCTSCWNRRELNDLSIAMALGIDKAKEDHYQISIQVVLPEEAKEPSYYTPVKIYSEKAKSLFEAFRRMTTEVPRKVYLPHFRIMVIGEDLAKEGITDILDMLIRDHEFRSDFYIIVSKDGYTAKDILEVMTPFEKIPSQEMFSILETSETAWAPTVGVKLDDLINNLKAEGKEAVLTGVTIEGKGDTKSKSKDNVEKLKPNGVIKMSDIAVFKGDKLVGWLNEKESKGYNYLSNNVVSTVGAVNCPDADGTFIVEIKKADTKIKSKIKDSKPEINISASISANIGEARCNLDLENEKTVQKLQSSLEKQVKDVLSSSVKAAQEDMESDIFGFGENIHKSHPKEWEKLKDNWENEFKDLTVTYDVKANIKLTGTIDQSLFGEK